MCKPLRDEIAEEGCTSRIVYNVKSSSGAGRQATRRSGDRRAGQVAARSTKVTAGRGMSGALQVLLTTLQEQTREEERLAGVRRAKTSRMRGDPSACVGALARLRAAPRGKVCYIGQRCALRACLALRRSGRLPASSMCLLSRRSGF